MGMLPLAKRPFGLTVAELSIGFKAKMFRYPAFREGADGDSQLGQFAVLQTCRRLLHYYAVPRRQKSGQRPSLMPTHGLGGTDRQGNASLKMVHAILGWQALELWDILFNRTGANQATETPQIVGCRSER